MKRLKKLMAEYGPIALGTYLAIFVPVFVGFAVALHYGIEPEGVTGDVGLLFGAWVATKVTQPLRIAATLVLTPIVARVLRRRSTPTPDPLATEASAPASDHPTPVATDE